MSHLDSTPRTCSPTPVSRPVSGPASTPPSGPAVVLRWAAGRPVVVLSGEVDVSTAAQLRSVRTLLDRHGERVTVEASGVAFLDVSGLSALVGLAGPGGALLVLHPSPAVLRLLDLLRSSGLGPQELRAGPREEAVVLREPSATAPTARSTRGWRPAAR